mmetsp:Transcript_15504/g.58769  ORF Transcript_15504/g.58769 Transcript_15504/m.58769 type:complete len:392 (-) Transcript_15504:4669-5844(-)
MLGTSRENWATSTTVDDPFAAARAERSRKPDTLDSGPADGKASASMRKPDHPAPASPAERAGRGSSGPPHERTRALGTAPMLGTRAGLTAGLPGARPWGSSPRSLATPWAAWLSRLCQLSVSACGPASLLPHAARRRPPAAAAEGDTEAVVEAVVEGKADAVDVEDPEGVCVGVVDGDGDEDGVGIGMYALRLAVVSASKKSARSNRSASDAQCSRGTGSVQPVAACAAVHCRNARGLAESTSWLSSTVKLKKYTVKSSACHAGSRLASTPLRYSECHVRLATGSDSRTRKNTVVRFVYDNGATTAAAAELRRVTKSVSRTIARCSNRTNQVCDGSALNLGCMREQEANGRTSGKSRTASLALALGNSTQFLDMNGSALASALRSKPSSRT